MLKVEKFEDGEFKVFKARGKDIMVARVEGKYYAVEDKCTHMGCKLSEGTLNDDAIECPCHGSMFDLKTGKVLKGPAKKALKSFKIKASGDDLLIDV